MSKIAVIGSGIAGHVAAYRLRELADVTLYEADDRFGGHANTVDVAFAERQTPVDTGFIVYNTLTYPGLTALFQELEVETVETDMSFGCHDAKSGLQYSTKSLLGMFAQKKNLLSPKYLGVWRDFFRFRTYAKKFIEERPRDNETTVGDLVRMAECGEYFWKWFLYPMAGAIWSTAPEEIEGYPARSFLGFMFNHRMLDAMGQPVWRTVVGGSREYVKAIAKKGGFKRRSGAAVTSVERTALGIKVVATGQEDAVYDEVIIAAHSDDALKMVHQPSPKEVQILSSIRYQDNWAVLHRDDSMMPPLEGARAAWNVHMGLGEQNRVELTYDMNRLQHIKDQRLLVTLNPGRSIDEAKVISSFEYRHPFFDLGALRAQDRWAEISGVDGIHYCGAYWKWGFHEDGLWSAMRVVDQLTARWAEKKGA